MNAQQISNVTLWMKAVILTHLLQMSSCTFCLTLLHAMHIKGYTFILCSLGSEINNYTFPTQNFQSELVITSGKLGNSQPYQVSEN